MLENIMNIKSHIGENVTLVAVSKTKPLEDIQEAYNLGVRDFGENKVQELVYKMDNICHDDIKWHLIGHLQRNKVKYIVGRVHLIHSLDNIGLLQEIEKQYKNNNEIAYVLIQINVGKEESKSGVYVENLEELIQACENCSNVKVKGIMTIIPQGDDESSRKYFKETKEIFDNLKERKFKNLEMKYLSMGMTGDYKIAVEEGANIIRIGQGIFGKRDYNINA